MQPLEAAVDAISVDDATLVRQARQGDQAAWATIVGRHQEPMFRLAYLIVRDAADAEDVAQDAFVRAFRALDQFDTERPLRPWLLSIAANLARNQRRSLGRYWGALQRAFQAEPEHYHPAPDIVPAAEAQHLWQAVQRLRPDAQHIVYLRYFLGLSETEAAEALDIPKGTAKSRLSRALVKLRDIIESDFPDLAGTLDGN